MKVGYARVSTHGQDLQAQIEMLEAEGCEDIYSEKFTGTTSKRPRFQEMLDSLKEGDTLVVTKLDRFARSTIDALTTVKLLEEKDVDFIVLNMGGNRVDTTTPNGKLLFTIMSGFAEFERSLIVARTREGKEQARKNAKARGEVFKEGRPRMSRKRLDGAFVLRETQNLTFKQTAEQTGISIATLKRESRRRKAEVLVKEKE